MIAVEAVNSAIEDSEVDGGELEEVEISNAHCGVAESEETDDDAGENTTDEEDENLTRSVLEVTVGSILI